MAHAALIGELAEKLIASIASRTQDDPSFRRIREQTIKGLRDASHARTNQFEVKERLDGLVEKFSVRNRDSLADALRSRLDELPTMSKFLPEVLSLFLHLSERPVDRTDLAVLDGLNQATASEAELSWEGIVADGPLDEADIWDDVDRGYHSSGDETSPYNETDSEPTTTTLATSLAEDDFAAIARQHLVQPKPSLLDEVRAAKTSLQVSPTDGKDHAISELSVIREVITILQGLPSYLFDSGEASGEVKVRGRSHIDTAEQATLQDILRQFASDATQLNHLRRWTRPQPSDAQFVQSMQSSIMKLLSRLTLDLGFLAQRYIEPSVDQIVSIVECRAAIEDITRPVVRLSNVMGEAVSATNQKLSFVGLDALYDEACLAQMTGNDVLFTAILGPLLASIQTYMKLVQRWMQTGEIPNSRSEHFFVLEAKPDCELSRVWHDRYVLVTSSDGHANAPTCIQPFVGRIFASGKARAFLKVLSGSENTSLDAASSNSDLLDRAGLEQRLAECNNLQPFDQLLHDAIDDCLSSQSSNGTQALSHAMLHEHGMLAALDAIDSVYFAKDGALLQTLTETLFARIVRSGRTWKDPFMLTELVQDTLGMAPAVDVQSVTIDITSQGKFPPIAPIVRQFEQLELAYSLSWPIQNITRSSQLVTHASAFKFLLQVEYCSHRLCPQIFPLRQLQVNGRKMTQALCSALAFRNKFIWYSHVLRAHIADTCSTLHQQLTKQMSQADGIDAMATIWSDYEKRLQTSLLLTPKLAPIREAVVGVLELCEQTAPAIAAILEERSSVANSADVAEELDRGLAFVVAGLKAVSRAGGETHLAMLAERLTWKG
ncbi:hypothetical protein LTR78_000115 [Recurvomyces mirabilis]|uniref:Spindle pole body component n=1 Tax=Recurvomyces mirabilis TaxID=574656 RepID=A0AAE0WXB3_9PEZI|nr:hypothetical protein LTR78_000115 [Recurvomyces mirabilis]KAK5161772.1 hypothetical protein LTS14_000117 [Recurvomyces mirabilis]